MKKKLLALALSAVMMMGLQTATFASSEYTDVSEITIKKSHVLDGEGSSPEETFKLTQVSSSVKSGDAATAPALGAISDVAYNAGAATATGAAGAFTVALPTYTQPGVYEYILKETEGDTAGVTYHTGEIKLVVTALEQDGIVRVAAVHTEDEGEQKTDEFTNTYTANKLNVKKTVAGNMGDKNKEFQFTVTLTGPADKTWNNAVTVTGGASSLQQTGNVYTFTLSDGDTATFENIPAGVSYTVTEETYEGYDTKSTGTTGTMDNAEKTAAFTNTAEGDVDTGINMDSLPYIMTLVVIACAGMVLLVSRKRRFE
ncbi:MAG: FctA domain-containing protein [Eubacteriales bacterium]|nr:FctA domain-containing protein [Eubacteriales bacterium]